ncbi:MAG: hypothetical protein OEZ01_01910 [Candidatus Heimdallarchaeota archaeon]|nr:hypothetical protein [Candidatus Heimdallarchaeota archaeon]
MTTHHEEVKSHSVDLSEILDISVTEMLILQNLIRYPTSNVLRINLLENLNTMIGHKSNSGKKIPASSFYHKLDRLEKRGLISYDNVDGKVQSIQATDLGSQVMGEIKKISLFTLTDIYDSVQEMIPEFLMNTGITPNFEDILIINLEEYIDTRIIELISTYSKNSYILADDEMYEMYVRKGINPKIMQTKFKNGLIREADGFFDGAILVGYDCLDKQYVGFMRDWLKDTTRVVKKGGIILVTSIEDFPKVDHFVIQSMIEDLEVSDIVTHTGEESLLNELQIAGIKESKIFKIKGMLFGYGFA